MRALLAALILTGLCFAQGAPATLVTKEVSCTDVAKSEQKCYEAKVTNNGAQNIVGYTIAVDVVNFAGDWKRTDLLKSQSKVKPGKSHGETYDYPYAGKFANAKLDVVKFADGTEWRREGSTNDKHASAE